MQRNTIYNHKTTLLHLISIPGSVCAVVIWLPWNTMTKLFFPTYSHLVTQLATLYCTSYSVTD